MKHTLPSAALLAFAASAFVTVTTAFAQADDPRGVKLRGSELEAVYGEARTALVIGNGAYATAPLANPVNDADDVTALLEKRKFTVTTLRNADQAAMEAAIREFGGRLAAGGVGVFYYSGHAVQVAGRNFLLPVGAQIRSETDLRNRAVDAGLVLEQMENSRNRLNVVILDACRDNPYASSWRTASRGLGRMDAPAGTLIAYATAPGKTASDGTGRNGRYTGHLLRHASVPGKELLELMRDVTTDVDAESAGQQLPWMHSSVRGKFYFTPYGLAGEQLGEKSKELEHLRKLQAEQEAADAAQKKLEDETNARMARMDAEIARLRQQAQQPGQTGSSLDQIIALGERRETAAAELLAAQRKAEEERQKREAEIARVQAEARAKRKAEFEAAYAKYQRVVQYVEKGHLGAAEHLDAWKAICGDFGVKTPGDKPAALAWNDADGTVQLASLRVYGLGATGSPTPSTGATGSPTPSTGAAGVVAGVGDPGRMGQTRTIDLGGGVSLDLVWIAPGSFTMGSPDNEAGRYDDEGPQQRVTLSKGFWMGKYEVTQRQYQALMGSNPSYFQNAGADAPVEQVTWNDAKAFCSELQKRLGSDLRGLTARLPTEAEWEYACRAGTATALYTGGLTIRGDNNGPELDAIAWYGGNSEVRYDGGFDSSGWTDKQYNHSRAGTQPVGKKKPNAWGLYDMLGNVWEWCEDSKRGYTSSAVTDPEGSGSSRVLRGGSWAASARRCRSAARLDYAPVSRRSYFGFRVVVR